MKLAQFPVAARSHLNRTEETGPIANKILSQRGKQFDFERIRSFNLGYVIPTSKEDFDVWFTNIKRDEMMTNAWMVLRHWNRKMAPPSSIESIGQFKGCKGALNFTSTIGSSVLKFYLATTREGERKGTYFGSELKKPYIITQLSLRKPKPPEQKKLVKWLDDALEASGLKEHLVFDESTDETRTFPKISLRNDLGELTCTEENQNFSFKWQISIEETLNESIDQFHSAVSAVSSNLTHFDILMYLEPEDFDLSCDVFKSIFDWGIVNFTGSYAKNPLERPENIGNEIHRVPLLMDSEKLTGACVVHAPSESYLEYGAPTENKLHSYLKKTLRRFPDVVLERWQNETWVKTDLESL